MPITLRKRGYFSESYDHWRHWRETEKQPDPWKRKLPPKCAQTPPVNASPAISALSAPALVPLDVPFVDGQLYRIAGATEFLSRLDLYVADPAGPWLRLRGTMMKAPNC